MAAKNPSGETAGRDCWAGKTHISWAPLLNCPSFQQIAHEPAGPQQIGRPARLLALKWGRIRQLHHADGMAGEF